MKENVKSETYLNIYQLEKTYGTALILYYSSMRANNYEKLMIAKRTLSPLFHINGNINYSVLDVYTDYTNRKMMVNAPDLHNYLKDKVFTNKTKKPYSFEALDERHEEFNKRGLSFQSMKSTEDFETAFIVCDSFAKMKKECLKDYGLKTENDNLHRPTNYDGNVILMRKCMRNRIYLSKPENKKKVEALDGTLIDKKILNVFEIAKKVKRNNILQVIKRNDMFTSFSKEKLDIFSRKKTNVDIDDEIQILISCETDMSQQLALYSYWQQNRKKKTFNKEDFVEDILTKSFQFSD